MRVLPLGLVLLAGCSSRGENPSPQPETTAPPSTVTPAQAAKPLPPGRSPVPAPTEYAAAREVTVKGSSALHCETKMVREWLRVSCRGKNDTGGTPRAVTITRGEREQSVIYAGGGVTSLITPVTPGTELEANFTWSDKIHPLVIRWPAGAPQPIVLGEFVGAASPLDSAGRPK